VQQWSRSSTPGGPEAVDKDAQVAADMSVAEAQLVRDQGAVTAQSQVRGCWPGRACEALAVSRRGFSLLSLAAKVVL